MASQKESPYTNRNSLYTSYRSNEYPKQVTDRLTRYPVVVITVVNRDKNSSSAGSRMSNVLVGEKIGHAKVVCRTGRKTAQKENSSSTYKSAMRRCGQIQIRMRMLSGLVAIFTRYTKEKRSL